MEDKKYLDLSGLQLYDSKIKEYISGKISTATDNSLGVVKGGEQISVDNNGELHLIKLNDTTVGLNLHLSGVLGVGGSKFGVNDGKVHASEYSAGSLFNVDVNGNILGNSLSIGNGSQFNVSNSGDVSGFSLSIGTGSQFTVNSNGDVSINENNQLSIGSKISINGNNAAFDDLYIGLGYISGSNFSISGGGVNLSSGCYIQLGNINNLGIRIETINNTPSFYLQNNNILDSNGSRINSSYLTGQIGEGVSFSGLTQTQINELKTVLGI